MKKTKIVCTLGPASSREETLEKMLLAGMNVARLNFSHGTHQEHKAAIARFRRVRDRLGIPAAVLLDTKGPEIRLGDFEGGKVTVNKGNRFTLTSREIMGNRQESRVTYRELPAQVQPGTSILIDDGRIVMKVMEVRNEDIICKVTTGGTISSRKGVNVPKTHLDLEYLSEADKADLLFGIEQDVEYVAASFVRTAQDVRDLKQFLNENGGKSIQVISKIENMEGITHFKEILKESDGIMVARGDMGVEVNFAKLPGIQKKLIRACCQEGKPVITATQMLESMVSSPTPTRAEISDVANAVFDGTAAVMLSGESAMGNYPVETVKTMAKIVKQAEKDAIEVNAYRSMDYEMDVRDKSNAIGHAACTTASDLKARAILAITKSGYTAGRISRFRPMQPILAATPEEKVYHQMALQWGVFPVKTAYGDDWDLLYGEALEKAGESGYVKPGDFIVISAGMPLQQSGNTNLIRVETV